MRGIRAGFGIVLFITAIVLCAACQGSRSAATPDSGTSSLDPAAREFVDAFLKAHEAKDLEAEKKLVDWDNASEREKDHFLADPLKASLEVKVTASLEEIQNTKPFAGRYNLTPDKLLVLVFDEPRGSITVKYPIGKMDGKYYFALRK